MVGNKGKFTLTCCDNCVSDEMQVGFDAPQESFLVPFYSYKMLTT